MFNKFLKAFSVYNLINVIIAYAYEFVKIPAQVNKYAYLGAKLLGLFINVFSYISVPALLVSVFGVIYYFVKSIKAKFKTEAYTYLFINMVNVMSLSYFMILVIAQF